METGNTPQVPADEMKVMNRLIEVYLEITITILFLGSITTSYNFNT